MPLYNILKYLHILLAIVAVGFNLSYAIWLQRVARKPEHLAFTLRGIKFLDDYIANPAYVALLLTGLAMVFTTNIPLTTFWIAAALVLWFITFLVGFFLYTPTLRNQINALESRGADSAEYKALEQRGTIVGIALVVIVLAIIFLMVFKPNPFA